MTRQIPLIRQSAAHHIGGNSMQRRFIKTALGVACALTPLAAMLAMPAQAQSVTRPSQDVVLSIGRGQLVSVPGTMTDIFVANDEVADVQVKSQRQLYVFGKAGGETTVYASDRSGAIIWSANIRVGSNIDSVDQMLALAMPDAKIQVATMGASTVLLTGTVNSPEDAAEAEWLVKAFMGDKANVITRLRNATPLQVSLRVRFAEVSRSLVRSLGANLRSADSTGGFQFGIGQGRSFATQYTPGGPLGTFPDGTTGTTTVDPISPGTTIAGAGRFLGLDLLGSLDLAERDGLVTTLSEPNLTALSGETAEFLAGGEFPIPLVQGLGATTVQYKKYGVSLAYTPTVLTNGRISLRVRPEVSELSSQGAVTLEGFQIPALTVRRAETTIELGSGQSFMIAGLLSNNSQNTIDKAPGVGDLPILGNLFKSTEFRRGETELVIVVTPYLVNPVNDGDIVLPTDGYRSPTVGQQLLLNREHDGVSGTTRPGPQNSGNTVPSPSVGAAQDLPGTTVQPRSAEAATPGFSLN